MFFECGKSATRCLPDAATDPGPATRRAERRTGAAAVLAVAGLAVVALLVPVFSHEFVSVNDVYNHVARAFVLAHYDDDAAFQEYWAPNWGFVPYAGYDLLSMALLSRFSTGLAVKILLSLSLITLFAGALLLSRAVHGRLAPAALLAALFLLNRNLLSGIINYLFGLGIVMAGLAAWIAIRGRGPALRLVILAGFAMAACLVHPVSCFILGISVAGIELAGLTEGRTSPRRIVAALLVPAAAFLPPALCLVFLAPHPEYQSLIVYGSLFKHVSAFAVSLTYAPTPEAVGFAAIGILCLLCWATGRLHVDHRLLGAAMLLALAQFAAPERIGVATALAHRIPLAFWIILVCAMEVRIPRPSIVAGFAVLATTLFVSRTVLTQLHWTEDNQFYREARRMMSSLPPHSRIATAYDVTDMNAPTNPANALYYLPVLERAPKGDYVQTLFTMADQHPLVTRAAYARLADETLPPLLWQAFAGSHDPRTRERDARTMAAARRYDYLVFLKPADFIVRPTKWLALVASAPGIQVYSVQHDPA